MPDDYAFDPPEGVELNEDALGRYKTVAKDAGLTQHQFDALLKYDLERTQAANDEAVGAWNERVEGWREAARNDKEFGGQKFEQSVKQALSLVEKYADADFKALLKSPSESNPDGLAIGNHPAVLRFLHRIGKQLLSEPTLVQGDANAKPTTDEEKLKRMYPSMFKD